MSVDPWHAEHYGGVYRSVLETLRTLFVWLVSLGLYYGVHGHEMGEAWTPYSHLQAVGCAPLPCMPALPHYSAWAQPGCCPPAAAAPTE